MHIILSSNIVIKIPAFQHTRHRRGFYTMTLPTSKSV